VSWVKIPKEHHPIFRHALPATPRSVVMPMFGGLAAMVNGNIACALFGRSVMVRLGEPELGRAFALEGASVFDPMGRGAPREDKVMLPEELLDDAAELRAWLQRALDHTATLPRKAKKPKLTAKAPPAKAALARAVKPKPKRKVR
jgi:hypothetical protein